MSLPKRRPGWSRVHVMCPECEADVPADYHPGSPMVTGGPPDRWYPGDPPELDMEPECPECGANLEEHYDDMLMEAEEAAGDDY